MTSPLISSVDRLDTALSRLEEALGSYERQQQSAEQQLSLSLKREQSKTSEIASRLDSAIARVETILQEDGA